MRRFVPILLIAGSAFAQTPAPATTTSEPQAVPPPAQAPVGPAPVVVVTVPALTPVSLDTPYASPRDAARHWLQATLANLREQRDVNAGMRGMAQAFTLDRTYAAAAFDLGVLAAVAGKWDDAAGAFDASAVLDPPGLGVEAKPAAEQSRLFARLDPTPEGRRKRRYNEALLALLPVLAKLTPSDALTTLAELGRIDPHRWEAPALLAGLQGDSSGYEVSASFLDIAVKNAGDPAVKASLEKAKLAADREVRYASARLSGDIAAENGKYSQAATEYESAWSVVPARAVNAMDAASASLLNDDTAHAAALLARLRTSGDAQFGDVAAAMLKELEPIEPAAKASASGAKEFYHDPGTEQPVQIARLIPPIDTASLAIYQQPLPKLVNDPEPVRLLASFVEGAPETNPPLPALPSPSMAGDHPWSEIQSLTAPGSAQAAATTARPAETADLASGARVHRSIQVTTEPAGAQVFVGAGSNPACATPCTLQVGDGTHSVRLSLAGYEDEHQNVVVRGTDRQVQMELRPVRGAVVVVTGVPVPLLVNGTSIGAQSPAELSLLPGLYRIGAQFSGGVRERALMVKPGARLHLELQP